MEESFKQGDIIKVCQTTQSIYAKAVGLPAESLLEGYYIIVEISKEFPGIVLNKPMFYVTLLKDNHLHKTILFLNEMEKIG